MTGATRRGALCRARGGRGCRFILPSISLAVRPNNLSAAEMNVVVPEVRDKWRVQFFAVDRRHVPSFRRRIVARQLCQEIVGLKAMHRFDSALPKRLADSHS